MQRFSKGSLLLSVLATFFSIRASATIGIATPPFTAAAQTTVSKLRSYCGACHAVGSLRFIRSDDDREVWQYLFTTHAPNSSKFWAEEIISVLTWPSDAPPPFDQPMDPGNNRDWMPKGAKRLSLAEDRIEGRATRRFMLEALQSSSDDPESEE